MKKAILSGLTLGLLSGCMVGPNYRPVATTLPASWRGEVAATQPTTQPATQPAATQPVAVLSRWWQVFEDPTLTLLVERALENNLDLRLAQARLRQARATRDAVSGELWPSVDSSGSYSRSRSGQNGFSATRNQYRLGVDASWELDIFGGFRRQLEAAEADVQASDEDLRATQLSLAGEVAFNYLDLRGAQEQILIAQENLQAQKNSLELTRKRFEGGFVSGLDLTNARAQVATTEAQIPVLKQTLQKAIDALSVLLDRAPGELDESLMPLGALPRVVPLVPLGLPSELLRRRPDIRRLDAQWHAATARIGQAKADLFPKFSLTGAVGFQSGRAAAIADWASRSWSFGPSVQWNIFDAGRVRANVRVQESLQQQAFLNYRKAVLTAIQEVESALDALAREREHREALNQAVEANRHAVALARELYRQGQTDFLSVLEAQRNLYSSQDALARSQQAVLTDLVSLLKALGGGWESP